MSRSVDKTFYFYLFNFLTGEKKANPELKPPSINQLNRKKQNARKNNDTLT